MRFFAVQILQGLAVLLGFSGLVSILRSSKFSAEMDALVNPSNAEIYPLENAALTWFGIAFVMVLAGLGLSGFVGRMMNRERTIYISIVLWAVIIIWVFFAFIFSFNSSLGFNFDEALARHGVWLVLPPFLFTVGFWLLHRSETAVKNA